MHRIDTPNRSLALFGAGKDGWRDGNMSAGVLPTEFNAAFMNNLQEEIAGVIEASGAALNSGSSTQLLLAIQNLIEVRAGNYSLDTGAANAYVVTLNPVPAARANGMPIRFKVAHANTGASTVNDGFGAVSLLNDVGAALASGDLPLGDVVTAVFDTVANAYSMISMVPSQAMSQAQADARYMQLGNFISPYADATGTSDAITASYTVPNATLYDGFPLALGIVTPNGTTTPNFAPTINTVLQTARTIVKFVGNVAVPLAIGDLQGVAEFRYDLPNTRWILQNPAPVSVSSSVQVRQTVLQGPVDTAGLPTFLPATSASLSITTQSISTGSSALVVTVAQGSNVSGNVNVVGQSTTNLTFTGCTANSTNFLPVSVNADGTLTPQTPLPLAPIYQWGGTPSVTNGQYTFNIQQMTMYKGNGSTAPAVNHVIVGEAVAGASTITSTIAYAYMGRYTSAEITVSNSTTTAFSHNIGLIACWLNIDAWIRDAINGNWLPYNIDSNADANIAYNSYAMATSNTVRNSFSVRVPASATLNYADTGGTDRIIASAGITMRITRGW